LFPVYLRNVACETSIPYNGLQADVTRQLPRKEEAMKKRAKDKLDRANNGTNGIGRTSRPPSLCIQSALISDLTLNPQNARVHSKRQIKQLAKSIETFGFVQPVLVDGTKRVRAGHGRIEAAKLIGLREVPTISIHHLSETQLRAFVIADNRLAEQATWDENLLREEVRFLSEVNLDFPEAMGFEVGEIDLLIEGLTPVPKGELDPADALPEKARSADVSQLGDLWLLGRHRVYCGNSLNEQSYVTLMHDQRATIVFTDPPYNIAVNQVTGLGAIQHTNFKMAAGEMTEAEFTDFLTQGCKHSAEYSVGGSLQYWFMDWRHSPEILHAGKRVYGELKNVCVWAKDNAGMGSFYRSQHEFVFVFKNGRGSHRNNVQLGQFGRYRTNLWQYPGVNSFSRTTEEGNLLELHPTVKPVALVADALMDASARGEVVLDPFLGSGTTVIAAERVGRVCYGIELDPQYVDVIIRRWQKFTGLSAKHAVSGRTFVEIEEENDV
jgi:DNA modification methylase